MAHFGDDLRKEREGRGVSLETLAAETRIKIDHLHALEEERYQEMPGGVFRRGIVQAYTGALGVETAPWLNRFDASYAEQVERTGKKPLDGDAGWVAFAENIKRSRPAVSRKHSVRWLGVLVLLAGVLLAAWAVWRFLLHSKLPPV